MRICTKCRIEKEFSEFHKSAKGKYGFASICRYCVSVNGSTYRVNNAEKLKANNNVYRINNVEKIRTYSVSYRIANYDKMKSKDANYYSSNTEKCKARDVIYQANNVEKVRVKNKKWKANNRNKCRIYNQNRRAREIEDGGKLSNGLAEKLFKLQRGLCPCCNQPLGDNYHLDHIMPLALGGSNTDNNIQLLRSKCNQEKKSKDPIYFMQSRGFLL